MNRSRTRSVVSKTMRPIALSAILGLVTSCSHAQTDDFAKSLETRVAARWAFEAEREEALLDKDKFTVILCGTGSPTHRNRVMACTAVFVNGKFFMFDAGDGAVRSMENLGLPLTRLTAIFVTHFHSDHMDDLGEAMDRSYILGRRTFLPIIGGEGIEEIVEGIRQSYNLELSYRTAHHGEKYMPSDIAQAFKGQTVSFNGPDDGQLVYDQDGVKVTAFQVAHNPIHPAMGFRVDYAGKSVLITGDSSETPNLHRFSRGADVLVSEVMNKEVEEQMEKIHRALGHDGRAKIFLDIRDYHLGTDEVGKLATGAGVKTVILTHLIPSTDDDDYMNRVFRDEVAKDFKGEIIVGKDGTEFVLP